MKRKKSTPTLQIQDMFTIKRPRPRLTIPLIVGSILAVIGFMTHSLFFFPMLIAIFIVVYLSLGLFFSAAIITTRALIVPSANELLKAKKGDHYYQSNTSITLKDGVVLTGAFLPNQEDTGENKDRGLVIVFHGNSYFASNAGACAKVKATNAFKTHDILEMNYRGTANSEGTMGTQKQNVKDGIEIVEAAIARGYCLKNIVLLGHCLGASIAVSVKAHFSKQRKAAEFPTLIAYQSSFRLDKLGSRPIKWPLLKMVTEKIVHLLLGCMGWNYQFSPKEWKSLKGTNIAIGGGKKDKIVPPYMDLAVYLKDHGITSNVWVRDEDHNTFNFECMRFSS